jgi:hypothetical protein
MSTLGVAFSPQRRAPFVSHVLRPSVVDVHDPGAVEDVARRGKSRRNAWWKSEIEERPESQEHAPAFIGDGRPASLATELAWESVARCSAFGVVEMEIFDTAHETHVRFPEDDGPLKRRTVQGLTLETVADLRIDRVGTNVKGDGTAMALGTVSGRERRVVPVRRRVLPALFFCHHIDSRRRTVSPDAVPLHGPGGGGSSTGRM